MYYIYPKGVTGEQLALMMKNVDGIEIDFIDDGDKELCFEVKKENIGNNDVVYVALSKLSPDYEENLKKIVDKLERHKINYVLDGVIEYVKKSICQIKEECRNEGINKNICLVMSGSAKNKYFGKLGEVLAQKLTHERKGGIIYICADRFSYQQYLQVKNPKIKCLYISYEFLELVDLVNVFLIADFRYKCPQGANVVYLDHGLKDYKMSKYESYMGNALCVAGPKFSPLVDFPKGVDIVKCGYLGFDNIADKIDNALIEHDSVLVAPCDLNEMYAMERYILPILEKYRVIFRLREEFGEEGVGFCEKFAKYKNFCIDNTSGFALESYMRTFCMICASTSSKNSFPVLSLCPVIVLPHNSKKGGLNVDKAIGINCNDWISVEKMLEIINEVYSSLPFWRQRILEYRNSNIYNFGKASEALADYLIEKYQL